MTLFRINYSFLYLNLPPWKNKKFQLVYIDRFNIHKYVVLSSQKLHPSRHQWHNITLTIRPTVSCSVCKLYSRIAKDQLLNLHKKKQRIFFSSNNHYSYRQSNYITIFPSFWFFYLFLFFNISWSSQIAFVQFMI